MIFDRHVIENNFGFWNDSDGSDQSGLHLLLTAVVYEALAKAERDKRTRAAIGWQEESRRTRRPPDLRRTRSVETLTPGYGSLQPSR